MLDSNGRIPPHTECPYKEECQSTHDTWCKHTGTHHVVAFSCALARGFETVARIRNKKKPLQLNLI